MSRSESLAAVILFPSANAPPEHSAGGSFICLNPFQPGNRPSTMLARGELVGKVAPTLNTRRRAARGTEKVPTVFLALAELR